MTTDMTHGSIPRHLTGFAMPLILGNLFQLTYNAADSIIVGRFAGDAAQACVGTANPLLNVLLFFIIGACTGAGVLMSERFGAQDGEGLRRVFATGLLAGGVFSLVLCALFVALSRPLLWCIRTPEEILPGAASYLAVVSGALPFMFLYNFFAAALRSAGDSKTPLVFLIIACCTNVVLDCVFVIAFGWGAWGAGFATLLAQALSAVLCALHMRRRVPQLWVPLRKLSIDKQALRRTVDYAWATGMQKVALMVGKVLIQAAVNPLGVGAIAAFNAVNRVDDFVFEPEQSIGAALTTFVAQNRGAKQPQRLHRAFRTGITMELVYGMGIGVLVFLAAPHVMTLFVGSSTTDAALAGTAYLRMMSLIYTLPGLTNGMQGYIRGFGRMQVCLIATSVQMVGRVGMAYVLVPRMGLSGTALACLCGWLLMLCYEVPWIWHNLRYASE